MSINGKDIVGRIDFLLKGKNLKRKALADSIGISIQPFTSWANRGSIPGSDIAYKISKYFGVSMEWLLTGHEPDGLTDEDRRLLEAYHLLDGRDREDVLGIIEGKLERSTLRQGEGTEKSGHAG